MSYLKKLRGGAGKAPAIPPLKQIGFIWLGGFIAAAVIGFLAFYTQQPFILGSFGASIFVLFILPDTPFAQPRNVVGGHFISSFIGLVFFHYVSPEWWSMALALATALSFMQILKVPHPPAGSNPFIVFLAAADWEFLFLPTLIGSVVLVIVALFYNNLSKERTYPKYWI